MSEMLRVPEAAEIVGVQTRELLAMIDRGEIAAEKVDGLICVSRADAEAAAEGGPKAATR